MQLLDYNVAGDEWYNSDDFLLFYCRFFTFFLIFYTLQTDMCSVADFYTAVLGIKYAETHQSQSLISRYSAKSS